MDDPDIYRLDYEMHTKKDKLQFRVLKHIKKYKAK